METESLTQFFWKGGGSLIFWTCVVKLHLHKLLHESLVERFESVWNCQCVVVYSWYVMADVTLLICSKSYATYLFQTISSKMCSLRRGYCEYWWVLSWDLALSGCLVSPEFPPFNRPDRTLQMNNEMSSSLKQQVQMLMFYDCKVSHDMDDWKHQWRCYN